MRIRFITGFVLLVACQTTPKNGSTTGGGAAADTTPPTVASASPAADATGVDPSTAVSVSLSEALAAEATGAALGLSSDAGSVAGALTYDAAGAKLTFTPSAALNYGVTYTATLSGVRDVAGNLLTGTYVWHFTTLPGTTPSAGFDSPSDGAVFFGPRDITVEGHLADTLSDTVTATLNSVAVSVDATATSFSIPITLGDSSNTLVVTVSNASGRVATLTLHVSYPFVGMKTFQEGDLLVGQTGFNSGTVNPIADNQFSEGGLFGAPLFVGGLFYVSDCDYQRVLVYDGLPSATNTHPKFILGQATATSSDGGSGQGQFDCPQSIRTYGGKFYVGDYSNDRIQVWNAPPTSNVPADAVLGQSGFIAPAASCNGVNLNGSEDFIFVGDKLIVADSVNNRVLIWNSVPASGDVPANVVLGQGDTAHCQSNDDDQDGNDDGQPSARTMEYPGGVASDGTRLFVSDSNNNRVLVWNKIPSDSFAPADAILGQDDPTQRSSTILSYPYMLSTNGNQLAVADNRNNRVLVWNTLPTTNVAPDVILGQTTLANVSADDDNQDTITDHASRRVLNDVVAAAFIDDTLWVADNSNQRFVGFHSATFTPCAPGQYEYPVGSKTCVTDPCAVSECSNSGACDNTAGAATCACNLLFSGTTCDACTAFVDPSATGTGDGSTWANALVDLSSIADVGTCEFWVRAGTYYVYENNDGDTVQLKGGKLYGGFIGTETDRSQRDVAANPTIFDGHTNSNPASFQVQHVVTFGDAGGSLDGFTVTGGASQGGGGGAILTGSANITNCHFTNNSAQADGGAIDAWEGDLMVTNSSFDNNSAVGGGGAISEGSTINISDSTFTKNSAFAHGGAIATNASITIANTSFIANYSGSDGGVLFLSGTEASSINDTDMWANVSGGNGGAIHADSCTLTVTNAVLAGNTAVGNGGALDFEGLASANVVNNTIYGNNAASGGGFYTTSDATISNTILFGNLPGNIAASGGVLSTDAVITTDPTFVRVAPAATWATATSSTTTVEVSSAFATATSVGDVLMIGDNGIALTVGTVGATTLTFSPELSSTTVVGDWVVRWPNATVDPTLDLHLAAGSNCIDAGDDDVAPTTDKDGHARNGTSDVGAYEH